VSLDALSDDALVATASLVGAPASKTAHVTSSHHLRAWELLTNITGRPIQAVITCENGGTASINGWLQAAAFGIPVADAPANGRAHPTGEMGGMALETADRFVSLQAVAGGSAERGLYIEQQVRGSTALANRLVRTAADLSGGLVAVARNPVSVAYVRQHAAPGALSQALALGRRVVDATHHGVDAVADVLANHLGATRIAEGRIDGLELRSEGGFDVGLARIGRVEMTIWNEYLTLDVGQERLATFPDLIIALDRDSALPLTSAELALSRSVAVFAAPASVLILGAGMRVPANFLALERAVGRDILRFVSCGAV
jgi:hypothetical protein